MSGRSGPPPMKFGNPGERLRKKRWNLDELPKFEKNFYVEHPEVQHMSQVNLYISLFPSHSKTISDSINLYEKLESMTKIHKPTNINEFKPLNNKVESCLIIISYLKKIFIIYTPSQNVCFLFFLHSGCCVQYEMEEFRRKKEITIRGSGCPKAITAFHQLQFPR